MDAKQAREVFNQIAANTDDADQRAKIELAREYFCNPEFRQALSDYTFALTREV